VAAQASNKPSAYHCAFKTRQEKSLTPLLASMGVLSPSLRKQLTYQIQLNHTKHIDKVIEHLFKPTDLEFLFCRIPSPKIYFIDSRTGASALEESTHP
jgi:hypothetical protein